MNECDSYCANHGCNQQPLKEKIFLYTGRQSAGDRTRTHAMTNTPIYAIWDSMIQRCYNEKRKDFKSYGGRGIGVCDRWRHNFLNFFEDMGHRPNGMTLDRIDVNKGYSKENCKWSTIFEQARNRTNSKMVSFFGKTQCITDWANDLGINKITLQARISNGWTVERALTTPVEKKYSHQKNRKNK